MKHAYPSRESTIFVRLILLTGKCHLNRRDRYDKVLISYKIIYIRSGSHDKTRDPRGILKEKV